MRGAPSPEAGWCGEAVAEHRPDAIARSACGVRRRTERRMMGCAEGRWRRERAERVWGAPEALSMVSRGLQPRSGCYPR